MIIYFWCFALSTLFAWLASRSKNKGVFLLYSIISILIPSILAGLRATGVGIDTITYGQPMALGALRASTLSDFIASYPSDEVGYEILTYAIMKTLGHENWCYFFYHFIMISCIYIGAYKHRKTLSLPYVMLVWLLAYYNFSYNVIRQSMAGSIIFMNIDQLETRQYKKFAVSIVVAFLFHHSAIIVFPLFFGMHIFATSETLAKRLCLKTAIFCVAIVSAFFVRSVLFSMIELSYFSSIKYAGYIALDYSASLGRSTAFIVLGEILMTFLYRKKGERVLAGKNLLRSNIEFYRYNLVFLLVWQYVIRFMMDRVVLYTSFINIILVSAIPHFIKEKHLRFIVAMLIICYYLTHWWFSHVLAGVGGTYPYRSIL